MSGILNDIQSITIGNAMFCAWIGALIGHIFSLYDKNFAGTKGFLQDVFPGRSDTFYKRLDFILLPIIGAFLAFILLHPNPKEPQTGVLSGLSWSGSLMALLKSSSNKIAAK